MTDPIIVEQTYNASVKELWKAITDQEQMRKWFFEPMTDFVPRVGFETQFDVECGGRVFPHCWKVTDVVPEKVITYDWTYDGYPGHSSVTWELSDVLSGEGSATANRSHLKLTHRGGESFPQDIPEFKRESGVAGWKYFLNESLREYLESPK